MIIHRPRPVGGFAHQFNSRPCWYRDFSDESWGLFERKAQRLEEMLHHHCDSLGGWVLVAANCGHCKCTSEQGEGGKHGGGSYCKLAQIFDLIPNGLGTLAGDDSAVRADVISCAELAVGVLDQLRGLSARHARKVVYVLGAHAAVAHFIASLHVLPLHRAGGCNSDVVENPEILSPHAK